MAQAIRTRSRGHRVAFHRLPAAARRATLDVGGLAPVCEAENQSRSKHYRVGLRASSKSLSKPLKFGCLHFPVMVCARSMSQATG